MCRGWVKYFEVTKEAFKVTNPNISTLMFANDRHYAEIHIDSQNIQQFILLFKCKTKIIINTNLISCIIINEDNTYANISISNEHEREIKCHDLVIVDAPDCLNFFDTTKLRNLTIVSKNYHYDEDLLFLKKYSFLKLEQLLFQINADCACNYEIEIIKNNDFPHLKWFYYNVSGSIGYQISDILSHILPQINSGLWIDDYEKRNTIYTLLDNISLIKKHNKKLIVFNICKKEYFSPQEIVDLYDFVDQVFYENCHLYFRFTSNEILKTLLKIHRIAGRKTPGLYKPNNIIYYLKLGPDKNDIDTINMLEEIILNKYYYLNQEIVYTKSFS